MARILFPLGTHPEVGLLHVMVVFSFGGHPVLFSITSIPHHGPTTVYKGSLPSNSSPAPVVSSSITATLTGARWYLLRALICISLMIMSGKIIPNIHQPFSGEISRSHALGVRKKEGQAEDIGGAVQGLGRSEAPDKGR